MAKKNWKEIDRKRGSSRERGYDNRWRKYRKEFLAANPLCVKCKAKGIIASANVVDHIEPHKGCNKLFWDTDNHQALCSPCHNSTKQADEKRGYSNEIGSDGWPVDGAHPFNKTKRF
ncbi:hypothetical protein WH95_18515 [Kiloniella litopenaei]|uniref:Putative HNH nuclease YajD n=1 Tax=Kiloniella litopenaei TaxID=1549748 RepID=A0A0M2R607_9PROT|nr:HNH endonuclease signature motif containing protein [Kiloniella litopenaei]KKJ75435.1 hypothetical protein WH95_18515 [Kiloniella litopenaei]